MLIKVRNFFLRLWAHLRCNLYLFFCKVQPGEHKVVEIDQNDFVLCIGTMTGSYLHATDRIVRVFYGKPVLTNHK